MIEPDAKKIWFKAKTYGYGWTPCTWQGWAVLAVYVCVLIVASYPLWSAGRSVAISDPRLLKFFAIVFVATVVLVLVAKLKGEKARWRWGEEQK